MASKGDVLGERYRLEEKIGKGAMGSVWRAVHVTLGTAFAIKIINAEAARNPEALKRFEREAVLAAKTQSEHVVAVIDHGHHGDVPYIVMECLEGESLRDRLDSRGRMSLQATAQVVRHIARALQAAHGLGLVHRDIKPENVFVALIDGEENIKVLDFGVAKVTDELSRAGVDPTRTGALLGTPFYLSPEQARGLKSLDHRADLWSLGVVVFECLTGKRPFNAPAVGPLLAKILQGPIPMPGEVAPDAGLPPAIDEWMRTALSREPEDRFGSAREMADAFSIAAGVADSASLPSSSAAYMLGTASKPATICLADDERSTEGLAQLSHTLPVDDLSTETLALPDAPPPVAVEEKPGPPPPWERGRDGDSSRTWTLVAAVAVVAAILATWLLLM